MLLLAIAGAVLTAIGGLAARFFDPHRRILQYLRLALKAEPHNPLVDRGAGQALAYNIDAGLVSVLWDRGRKGLIYRLDQLMGAEMMVDHTVLARVYRDEAGKRLDQIPDAAHRITLRLVFDNPRDPEFELELWPARHGRGHEYRSPAEAVQAGRRWLAGLEALLRRPGPARMLTRPEAPVGVLPDENTPPPWDEDDTED